MIKIYTSKNNTSDSAINQVDIYFDRHICLRDLDTVELNLMQDTDNATVVDFNTDMIRTPYGVASKDVLSSGCKTLILANYFKRKNISIVLCANECGQNIFPTLFQIVNVSCVSLLLDHSFIPADLHYNFCVNNVTYVDTSEDLRSVISYDE